MTKTLINNLEKSDTSNKSSSDKNSSSKSSSSNESDKSNSYNDKVPLCLNFNTGNFENIDLYNKTNFSIVNKTNSSDSSKSDSSSSNTYSDKYTTTSCSNSLFKYFKYDDDNLNMSISNNVPELIKNFTKKSDSSKEDSFNPNNFSKSDNNLISDYNDDIDNSTLSDCDSISNSISLKKKSRRININIDIDKLNNKLKISIGDKIKIKI